MLSETPIHEGCTVHMRILLKPKAKHIVNLEKVRKDAEGLRGCVTGVMSCNVCSHFVIGLL